MKEFILELGYIIISITNSHIVEATTPKNSVRDVSRVRSPSRTTACVIQKEIFSSVWVV